MKYCQAILLLFLLFTVTNYGQGVLKVTTDKTAYSYGDTMEVRVTLTNNNAEPFTIYNSSTCVAWIRFNDVKFQTMCTADQHEFYFSPGMSMTWIWYLDPQELGIPDKDGQQKIVGVCYPQKDSVYFEAPKFRGGKIYVGKKADVPESEYESLRDSIGATVLYKTTYWSEYWQIKNHSIDSIVEKYSKDYRFTAIEAMRQVQFAKEIVTSVDEKTNVPFEFSLSQNYPNPFNPTTLIDWQLAAGSYVTLKVYDMLGREVATLVDEFKQAGYYNSQFSIRNYQLSSGVYFYTLTAGGFRATKKLVLMK